MTDRVYRLWAVVAALVPCLLGIATSCPAADADGPATVRLSDARRLMGVSWTITVYASSADRGREAIDAGFDEVARLEAILSDYDPASELSRLSAAAPTATPRPVGDDLWRVLEQAVRIRDATAGGFDPTVGPLTTLWRQTRRSGRLPPPEKLAAARAAVGADALRLVPEARAVSLERAGMRLDLGGIGMGYAADRALEVLERHGIRSAMIDASGDILVSAAPPGAPGWKVDVAALRAGGVAAGGGARLLLSHAAVTTSGDAYQAVEIGGRRYSHVVDPRTGLGVAGPAAATVVAPDCTTADALATAASVLGPRAAAAVIEREPGCAARFSWVEAGEVRTAETPRWSTQTSQPRP